MSNASKYYLDYIHSVSSGYRATWDPALPLAIGSIVKIDNFGVVNTYGALSDKSITMKISESHSALGMDLSSQKEVQINITAAGSAPAGPLSSGNAVINIQFGDEHGVIFKLGGYKTSVIVNLSEIEEAVLALYKNKQWDPDLLIVTNLVTADTATIIISDKGSASLDLKAAAGAGIAELDLTNAKLGLTIASQSGSTTQFIASQGISPLYKVMGLKGAFMGIGDKRLDTRDLEAVQLAEEMPGLAKIEPVNS